MNFGRMNASSSHFWWAVDAYRPALCPIKNSRLSWLWWPEIWPALILWLLLIALTKLTWIVGGWLSHHCALFTPLNSPKILPYFPKLFLTCLPPPKPNVGWLWSSMLLARMRSGPAKGLNSCQHGTHHNEDCYQSQWSLLLLRHGKIVVKIALAKH